MIEGYKIEFLRSWADQYDCSLELMGEIGFGRECVGITWRNVGSPLGAIYVSYRHIAWNYKDPLWAELSQYTPESAYHKDSFLAVLGRDDDSLEQLFTWCHTLSENGWKIQTNVKEFNLGEEMDEPAMTTMSLLLTGRPGKEARLVKNES